MFTCNKSKIEEFVEMKLYVVTSIIYTWIAIDLGLNLLYSSSFFFFLENSIRFVYLGIVRLNPYRFLM